MINRSAILKTMQVLFLATTIVPSTASAETAVTARQLLGLAQSQSQTQLVKADLDKMSRPALSQSSPEPPKWAERSQVLAAVDPLPTTPLPTSQASEPVIEKSAPNEPASAVSILNAAAAETTPGRSTSQLASIPIEPRLELQTTKPEMQVEVPIGAIAGNSSTADLAETKATSNPKSDAAEATRVPVAQLGTNVPSPMQPTLREVQTPAAVPAKLTKATADDPAPHQQRKRTRATDNLGSRPSTDIGERFQGRNVGPQLRMILNRPEVKSLMAQYGLN
ncbi:hypothetical protein ACVWWO_000421 [Bradyrhizobium sp. F1.13.1]